MDGNVLEDNLAFDEELHCIHGISSRYLKNKLETLSNCRLNGNEKLLPLQLYLQKKVHESGEVKTFST